MLVVGKHFIWLFYFLIFAKDSTDSSLYKFISFSMKENVWEKVLTLPKKFWEEYPSTGSEKVKKERVKLPLQSNGRLTGFTIYSEYLNKKLLCFFFFNKWTVPSAIIRGVAGCVTTDDVVSYYW